MKMIPRIGTIQKMTRSSNPEYVGLMNELINGIKASAKSGSNAVFVDIPHTCPAFVCEMVATDLSEYQVEKMDRFLFHKKFKGVHHAEAGKGFLVTW